MHSPTKPIQRGARNRRRGVALLIVLGAVLLGTTLTLGVLRMETVFVTANAVSADAGSARSLLHAAEDPIRQWLSNKARQVSIPSDQTSPSVAVFDESLLLDSRRLRLRVTTFDQLGMTPFTLVDRMLEAVPLPRDAALSAASRFQECDSPGLDILTALRSPIRVFPRADRATQLAIGEIIATHNPPPRIGRFAASQASPGMVNINTAPLWLVRQALERNGLTGIERIAQARANGQAVILGSFGRAAGPASSPNASRPKLVFVSTAWSFRIDAIAGDTMLSLWETYVEHEGEWLCVQRLIVDE